MTEIKKSCGTCVYKDEPAQSQICRDCWNYRRWANWTLAGEAGQK